MSNGPRRTLRANQTDAEAVLWLRLRNRQLAGYKFRRQHSVDPYIVDFVCIEKRLIVEVDGGQHATNRQADAVRTRFLEQNRFKVIRFWNNEVLQETNSVVERILSFLDTTA